MKIQLGQITVKSICFQIDLFDVSKINMYDFIEGDIHLRSELANRLFNIILDYIEYIE